MVERRTKGKLAATSKDLNSFEAELRHAGDRADLVRRIDRLREALVKVKLDDADRKLIELGRGAKKNFAQALSTAIAQKTADALRADFKGIFPTADGKGHESKSSGAGGLKKLDVNYSTTQSGLGLAVSIKTINFKDEVTNRYTKNTKRVDGELRAEAQDCHIRQPFAALVAYLFLPLDAASDGEHGSSLKHNADVFADRCGRNSTSGDENRFELGFVGLYNEHGETVFFKPNDVPLNGLPKETMKFSETLDLVRALYKARNRR